MSLHYRSLKILILSLVLLIGGAFFSVVVFAPPVKWQEQTIEISSGSSLVSIASLLERENVVRSRIVLQSLVIIIGNEESVKSGTYSFKEPVSVFEVAQRLLAGDYQIVPVRVRIPEGSTLEEMSVLLEADLPKFNKEEFLLKARDKEGYLFPDTYFFSPDTNADMVIKTMSDNFDTKLSTLTIPIDAKYTLDQYVTLASIIEKEATQDEEERAIVSGILHSRLEKGMLLQVDATLKYALGKTSSELRVSDLQADFPFNTYVHAGLPPHAIGAPGLSALKSAMYPKNTEYLFYLHDLDGNIYYASTHTGHVRNKQLYLR